jgi:hypothetical protein
MGAMQSVTCPKPNQWQVVDTGSSSSMTLACRTPTTITASAITPGTAFPFTVSIPVQNNKGEAIGGNTIPSTFPVYYDGVDGANTVVTSFLW